MQRAKRIWFHRPLFGGGLALGVLAALVLIGAAVALSNPARAAYPSQASGGVAAPARPNSTSLVISQVYGGGGNSGALYTHDFIELFNPTNAPVAITNWSVQYGSATGNTWQVSTLTGTITLQPGQYYLIQEAQGAGGSQPLPTPDSIGSIAMGGTAGKVALVSSNTALACGTNCHAAAGVVDFVGYGTTANDFEGSGPAPAPANPSSDLRANGGCTDTDNNATDFAVSNPPTPRNSASTFNPCGAQPTATPTITPGGPTNTPTITRTPPPPGPRIHTIQGASHLAPFNGQSVANVQGIVTALRSNGFYMQDPVPDADNATSEAIFVFTSSAPAVSTGQLVAVSGQVTEFRAGGSGGLSNLTQTEIASPTISVLSSGNALPTPVVIGTGGRIPPNTIIEDDAGGDVETGGVFDPDQDGIDFYESLESMRVQVNNPVATGPTNSFGEISVLGDNGANAGVRTTRGGIIIQPADFNPERVILDGELGFSTPNVNTGDHFSGPAVGILDYTFGNFKLQITQALTGVSSGLAQEVTTPAGPNEIAIGNFNVENLSPADPPAKFDTLADLIVNHVQAPDIISVEEIQDNSGPTDNGIVAADQTWTELINAIITAGGPTYDYRQINPVNNQDGGQPGGNIRQGFLFRTDRGVSFIDRPGGCSTCATSVQPGPQGPILSFSPGRIDPQNGAFLSSRKPLAGEFLVNGQRLFVIGNHFNSKGGDDPLFGHIQPPVRSSETQRHQQAQVVNDFVDQILALDSNANIVVLGDLNDFSFSDALLTVRGGVLHDLITTLPLPERYTYVFDGNAQDLDHILVSNHISATVPYTFDVVHVNSEFTTQASDHEPQVARFAFGGQPTPTATATATPGCISGWQVVSSPNPGNIDNTLYGLAALASDNVWAVGNYRDNGGPNHTLITHWDGITWTAAPSPSQGILRGVSALSANNIWAVGYTGGTLALHWDGASWTTVPSPNPGTSENYLYGVEAVSPTDVWAVGAYSNGFGYGSLIFHWDGTTWTNVGHPTVTKLFGLNAIAANDVWAVGERYDGTEYRAVTLHWDGSVWSTVPSPNLSEAHLYAVSGTAANDVWAVGTYNFGDVTLVEHWDGTSWTQVPSPNTPNFFNTLQSVVALSPNDAWAVGYAIITTASTETIILHWDGTTWTLASSPNPDPVSNSLYSVAAISSNDLWTAGYQGTPIPGGVHTLLAHYTGACVTPTPATATPTITPTATPGCCSNVTGYGGAYCIAPDFVSYSAGLQNNCTIGTSGTMTVTFEVSSSPGGPWTIADHAGPFAMNMSPGGGSSVSGGFTSDTVPPQYSWYRVRAESVATDHCWTVNQVLDPGPQLLCQLVTPTASPSPVPPTATATPLCTSGWGVVPSPSLYGTSKLNAVAVVAPDDVWAVGYTSAVPGSASQTLIEHWDGSAWTVVPSPNIGTAPNELNAVTAISANDVWAVGYFSNGAVIADQTMIVHWNGTVWDLITSPNAGTSHNYLFGVAAVGPNDVWAVGNYHPPSSAATNALTLHWNGTAWSVVPSPIAGADNSWLTGVVAFAADDVWAVGHYQSAGPDQTLTLHWTGSQWNMVASPNLGAEGSALNGVGAISPNDMWAVGTHLSGGVFQTLTLHWDGTAWTTVASPNGVNDNILYAVSGAASNDVWAVGTYNSAPNAPQPEILHWDGTAWTISPSPSPGGTFSELAGVAAVPPAGAWAVGTVSNGTQQPLIERYTPPCATATPVPPMATATATVTATPTVCVVSFNDVPPNSTFYTWIRCLACRGIVGGYPCGGPGEPCPGQYYRPNNNVTRGQVSKIVSESASFSDPVPSTQQTFEDVPPSGTFWLWVERLSSRSIIQGYPCGGPFEPCVGPTNRPYFRPNNNVTRGQLSKITSGAAGWTETPTGQTFEDVPPGQTFYLYVERMAVRGIISGYPCGGPFEPCIGPGNRPYFRPNNNATRGQMAKIAAEAFFPNCQTPARR